MIEYLMKIIYSDKEGGYHTAVVLIRLSTNEGRLEIYF